MSITLLDRYADPGITEIVAVLDQHDRDEDAAEARRYGAGIGILGDDEATSPLTGTREEVDAWVIHLRGRDLWLCQYTIGGGDDAYATQTLTPVPVEGPDEAYRVCCDPGTIARHRAAGASTRGDAL